MGTTSSTWWRALAAAFVALGFASGASHAEPYASPYAALRARSQPLIPRPAEA